MDQSPEGGAPKVDFKDLPSRSKSDLCKACSRISIPFLTSELAPPPGLGKILEFADTIPGVYSNYGMRHLDNATDLFKTYKTCTMCALIIKAFTSNHKTFENIAEKPTFLCPSWVDSGATKSLNPVEDQLPLSGMFIWVPVDGHPHATEVYGYAPCKLMFYTDDESPHTFPRIVGRVPLSDPSRSQILSRLRNYLITCRGNHPKCFRRVAEVGFQKDEEPRLPRRVIDLGPPHPGGERSLKPRLIVTNKIHANYVAFSYSSSVREWRFRTRHGNLEDHLTALPMEHCPKTIRDVMELTREFGIRYLWVDMICILQDDQDEKLRDAQSMATVFEGAILVIADVGNQSFEDGLFPPQRHSTPSESQDLVRIPYHDEFGVAEDTALYVGHHRYVDKSKLPDMTTNAFQGRPWMTQEYLMPRRLVSFTPTGFVWSCLTFRKYPIGIEETSVRTVRDFKWYQILYYHLVTELKPPSERLMSLAGLAMEIAKRDFAPRYRYGMFEKSLESQLMWRVTQGSARRNQNPLTAPSWSWVSSLAEMAFFELYEAKGVLSSTVDWEECGGIKFEGDFGSVGNVVVVPAGKIRKLKKSPWWKKMKVVPSSDDAREDKWANTVRFDECETPGVLAGKLFALLLCTKRLKRSTGLEETREYFIVLKRLSKRNQTYERVGAGLSFSETDGEYSDNLPMLYMDCKVKSIRIA
ncbi:heterokaryon incompatibility protein domain-containing protein [Trichoderma barbatum]